MSKLVMDEKIFFLLHRDPQKEDRAYLCDELKCW